MNGVKMNIKAEERIEKRIKHFKYELKHTTNDFLKPTIKMIIDELEDLLK